ncbi:MAG: hypothetical protein GY765_01275, partial [bacterium]|nr:hypothetical protein [bacterium]
MIKREFKDIIKPVLLCVSPIALIPLLALFKVPITGPLNFFLSLLYITRGPVLQNVYMVALVFLMGFGVLAAANYCGTKAFQYEHSDKAFEYLMSLPISKKRIAWLKMVPRLAVLSLLTVLYEVVAFAYFSGLRPIQGKLFFLAD